MALKLQTNITSPNRPETPKQMTQMLPAYEVDIPTMRHGHYCSCRNNNTTVFVLTALVLTRSVQKTTEEDFIATTLSGRIVTTSPMHTP